MTILNLEEVSRITCLKPDRVLACEKMGMFPQRANERGWEHTDVEQWLAELPRPGELTLDDDLL